MLSKANYTYPVALRSSHLVIHFLTADDLPLAELFGTQSGDTVDRFTAVQWIPGRLLSGLAEPVLAMPLSGFPCGDWG